MDKQFIVVRCDIYYGDNDYFSFGPFETASAAQKFIEGCRACPIRFKNSSFRTIRLYAPFDPSES